MSTFNFEGSYTATVECTWTYCGDGTHMPTENGQYLVVNKEGGYEILDYFTEGSEIVIGVIKDNKFFPKEFVDERMTKDFGFNTKHIATRSGFFSETENGNALYTIRDDIYGYVKISDINVYRIGEKND